MRSLLKHANLYMAGGKYLFELDMSTLNGADIDAKRIYIFENQVYKPYNDCWKVFRYDVFRKYDGKYEIAS